MGIPLERKTPGRPAAESTSSELLKLVHKLRWAGMEEEAERLLKKLKHGQTPPEHSVVANTDRNRLDHDPIKLNRIMV